MSMGFRAMLLVVGLICSASATLAHELRPAYLELRQTTAETFNVLWKVPAAGDNLRLALYVRWPAGWVNLTEPRGTITGGAYLERWQVKALHGVADQRITIDGLASTMTDVLVRVEKLYGATEVVRLAPSTPSFVVEAVPSWRQIVWTYLRLGIEHILLGIDHLLFVLGLLLLSKGLGLLLKTVTSFTVGHSISLALATVGWLNVPGKPLGALIALSIVFLAAELVRARRHQPSVTIRRPWIVSFGFGLLHGLGFAGALVQLGLPRSEIPAALLLFNLGVEIAQVLFIVVVLALLGSLRRLELRWPVWAEPVPIYVMGSIAAFWFVGRFVAMF